ncbi:MAG: hypothetical protein JWN56_1095 [Sphingobacteriales bacterium]|nr:hypothetical protein [Sphingobacteriales bacterium]
MNAALERKVIRWVHIVLSIPIIGYIYGPVSENPHAVLAVQWVIFPVIVLSGLWLWKGHWLKKKIRFQRTIQRVNKFQG